MSFPVNPLEKRVLGGSGRRGARSARLGPAPGHWPEKRAEGGPGHGEQRAQLRAFSSLSAPPARMPSDPFDDSTPPPSLRLLMAESRVAWEAIRFLRGARHLEHLPRGDGHAILLVPGFGADERLMRPLCGALLRLGYAAEDWGQGRNLGMRPAIRTALAEKLETMASRSRRKVSLVGWSLGGTFARELARKMPEQVRGVITLGSPINRRPDANNMMALFRLANGGCAPRMDHEGFQRRRVAPPVPCTAIYSRTDGIVAWQACLEESAPNTRNIEVRGSHLGLVVNLEVLAVLAHLLAQDPERLSDRR